MTMCVSAGARARELPGCSPRTHNHGHHNSLPPRASAATASSSYVGRELHTTEASLPFLSRPPPCLRLPTPTGDPPPRSPLSKKPSPMLSSVSMLCGGPPAEPLISSEPSQSGTSSTRYELAAIALLSTVPLRPKGRSRSRMSPPKLSCATCRSSCPFPRSSVTRAPNERGAAAKSPPLSVASASPSTRNLGNSDARSNDFIVTRWSPQIASPVPRKSASSVPPPRLAAQDAVILRKSVQQGELLQPQIQAPPCCSSQGIREVRVSDDLKIAADHFVDIPERGVVDDHCLRNDILDRSTCVRCVPAVKSELSPASSANETWEAKVRLASGIFREPSGRSLWEGKSSGIPHRTLASTSRKGSAATWASREETHCPCESPLLQTSAVPTCPACQPARGDRNSCLSLCAATDTTRETVQPTGVPYLHARMGLSQLRCSSSHSYERQRTHRAKCADCTPPTTPSLPKTAIGDPCVSVLPEPLRSSSPPAEHTPRKTWHAPNTQCLGDKEADTDIQQTLTCVSRGICPQASGSPVQTCENTGHLLSQVYVSLPSRATRRSVGRAVAAYSLSNIEVKGRAGTLTPVPRLTHSIETDFQPITGHSYALLHQQGGAAPLPTEDGALYLISAAGGLVNGARHETCSLPPRSPCSCQAPSSTTLDAVEYPGSGQVVVVGPDRTHAASGFPRVLADGNEFSLSIFNVCADQETQQKASSSVSTGARESCPGVQKRRSSGLDYSRKIEGDGGYRLSVAGGASGASFEELSQAIVGRKSHAQASAEEPMAEAVVVEDWEEARIFSELQHTLKELQTHTTALRPLDVIFGTEIPQELLSIERTAREAKNNDLPQAEVALLNSQASGMDHALQYCVLEEGSFGKVLVGRFLGKLPTNGGRRWWRTLPLCERFLQQAPYALPSLATGRLPLLVQEAVENYVKVAIKVPVESMMLRDPLGVLARTLNEWKILELVHEKRKILFSESHGREDADRTIHGIVRGRTTYSDDAACPKELGSYNYERCGSEDVSMLFCQEQFPHGHPSSRAFESWHPMHPQAEPPGIVELIGGVVHGPLNVWLVTRLATGKDLHTRKYSKRHAGGVAIPPAAGLAMCRQLAAIVGFLHARTKQTFTLKCATVDAVHSCRKREIQCSSGELLTCGGSEAPNNSANSHKGACEWHGEREPDRDLSCNVHEAPVIVHRDIKPENIIVDDNWRIQLCDFGDAEATPDGVVSRVSGATWLYAPVELLCAAPLDGNSGERGCECESCCFSGAKSGGNRSCTSANRTCCGGRARSCPTFVRAQNRWVEGRACDNADCAGVCPRSSYRGVDAVFTEKWDIWSMGCVFQEMFGLPNPMSSYVAPTDPPQIIYEKLKRKAQNGQLVPVVAPEIQGIARQIIFACLRSDPKARPSATAVLRMWSAPEQEILKDIRLPLSGPTLVHGALQAPAPTTTAHQRASPKKPLIPVPGIDRYRTLTRGHKEHEQKEDEVWNLNKSAPTFACPERPYSCVGRVDADTSTGGRVGGQEDVYIVPNVAVVERQCDLCVQGSLTT